MNYPVGISAGFKFVNQDELSKKIFSDIPYPTMEDLFKLIDRINAEIIRSEKWK